jgi:lantibiotic modifying enzyme
MAALPETTITTVLALQRRLLAIIDRATATEMLIFEQYGETERTLIDLEQLQNIQERADTYYSRFCILLRQIAQSQPFPTNAMLELLASSIEDAGDTSDALEASIQEIKQDWDVI